MKKDNSNLLIIISALCLLLFAAILYLLLIGEDPYDPSANNTAEIQTEELPDAPVNNDGSQAISSYTEDNEEYPPTDSNAHLQNEELQDADLQDEVQQPGESDVTAEPYLGYEQEQVENMVALIREDYNAIRGRTDRGLDNVDSYAGLTVYYYLDEPEMIILPAALSQSGYTEYYYYKNGSLIFSYYEKTDSYRYYFVNENLIRLRYCEDASRPENARNEDRTSDFSDELRRHEERVLAGSRNCLDLIAAAEREDAEKQETRPEEGVKDPENGKTEIDSSKPAAAITMHNIESISASSWKSEPEFDLYHRPVNLIDGDLNTAWCENVADSGVGETVDLYFDNEFVVSGIYIYPGYHKSNELFEKNGTPVKIRITGDHSETFSLKDEMKRQKLTFDTPMTTDGLTIEILKVRKGWKYNDTLITEIKLF